MQTSGTELFERYHVLVYRYFLRVTSNHDVAQDLTQELFLKVLRNIDACRPEHQGGWVFRIARNLAVDYRRTHPPRHVPLADGRKLSTQATQLLAFGLSEALGLLPELEREVFLLRELAGLSYEELATVCDTKIETVRARLYQARCRLRSTLGARLSIDANKRRNEDG